jgi:hypothetical protein
MVMKLVHELKAISHAKSGLKQSTNTNQPTTPRRNNQAQIDVNLLINQMGLHGS